MKRFLLFVIYYLSTWRANAQEGTWYGKLDIQGTILPVVFHFSDDGCTLDSPAQGAKGRRESRKVITSRSLYLLLVLHMKEM